LAASQEGLSPLSEVKLYFDEVSSFILFSFPLFLLSPLSSPNISFSILLEGLSVG
jgi:hypothetical protein